MKFFLVYIFFTILHTGLHAESTDTVYLIFNPAAVNQHKQIQAITDSVAGKTVFALITYVYKLPYKQVQDRSGKTVIRGANGKKIKEYSFSVSAPVIIDTFLYNRDYRDKYLRKIGDLEKKRNEYDSTSAERKMLEKLIAANRELVRYLPVITIDLTRVLAGKHSILKFSSFDDIALLENALKGKTIFLLDTSEISGEKVIVREVRAAFVEGYL